MSRTAPAPTYTAAEHPVPTVTATDLITSGNVQLVVCCPRCSGQHRHLGLGLRRSPCGAWYVLTPPAPRTTPKLAAA
jgi:hypothetical protein